MCVAKNLSDDAGAKALADAKPVRPTKADSGGARSGISSPSLIKRGLRRAGSRKVSACRALVSAAGAIVFLLRCVATRNDAVTRLL